MHTGLKLGLAARRRGGGAAFGVTFTGLTDGEARIGDHASIGYTTDPVSATETVKWSNSSNPADAATYGTGASPTDYTAGDEGSLWLHVTDTIEGESVTVSRSAPIRYAPGTASSIADGQTATVDDTVLSIAATATGANLTFTYSLLNAPAGMTTNSSTGGIGGTVTEVFDGTVTLRATDQYGRVLDDTFTFTSSLRTQATAANGLGPFMYTRDDTVVDQSVTSDFTANGNTLTYVLTNMPPGLVDDGDGSYSGTPTSTGSQSILATATDEYGRETVSSIGTFTVLRDQATGGTDLDLSFEEDSAISSTDLKANWTTNGNTLTYAIVGTALPTGLSVSSAGVMTGTPTTATADATYTLRGTDEYGRTTDDTFTLEITAAGGGWHPTDLGAKAQGIYEVHPDFCFTDVARTTNATVGDAVAALEDQSGNDRHLTNGTASKRPILRQDGSLYYLEFDFVEDNLTSAVSFAYPVVNAMGIDFTANDVVFSIQEDAIFADSIDNNPWAIISQSGSTSTTIETTTTSITSIRVDQSPVSPLNRGTLYTATNSAKHVVLWETAAAAEDLKWGVGHYNESGVFGLEKFYGWISANALTTQERDDLEQWLADKTGVTL
jgi:hypothetical protein